MATKGRIWAALGGTALLIGCVSGPAVSDEAGGSGARTDTSTGGMGMLWYATSGFTSYSLKLDWQMADTSGDDNSGVFVGFPPSDDPWSAVNNGYEIQIDATDVPEKTTGSVYGFRSADIRRRDRALNPPGEGNTYEIRVEGERLRGWLNGVKIDDFTNTDPARSLRDGHIGIQNHGADDRVSFRDVRIKWRSCPWTRHLFEAATAACPGATTTVRSSSASLPVPPATASRPPM